MPLHLGDRVQPHASRMEWERANMCDILNDLKRHKAEYQRKLEWLPTDEDGMIIDEDQAQHYRVTLRQIERDIARYS